MTQNIGIALTGFCQLDDLLGDELETGSFPSVSPRAARVISNARPIKRLVSGSNLWPSRNWEMGIGRASESQAGDAHLCLSATDAWFGIAVDDESSVCPIGCVGDSNSRQPGRRERIVKQETTKTAICGRGRVAGSPMDLRTVDRHAPAASVGASVDGPVSPTSERE